MSGPQNCSICLSKFGFMKKQYDCIKCNKTTCKDCQNFKMVVNGNAPQNVCKNCFDAKQKKAPRNVSPPRNFKRELEKRKMEEQRKDLESPEDKAIRDRLKKLKSDPIKSKDISVEEIRSRLDKLCATDHEITDEEIEYRLAKLKGSRPPAIRVNSVRKTGQAHSSKDNQSDFVQAKRLIRQFTEEIAMDTDDNESADLSAEKIPENPSSDDLIALAVAEIRREQESIDDEEMTDNEIRRRLSQLQELPDVSHDDAAIANDFNGSDIDQESAQLIKQIMAQDRLDQELANTGITIKNKTTTLQDDDQEKTDEFPWCFMCNDNATIRCITCERELFCKTCFKVVHSDSDMKGHQTEKFKGKNDDL